MPVLPEVRSAAAPNQFNSARGASDPRAFGGPAANLAAVGQGITNLDNALFDANQRIKARNDAVDRVAAFGTAREQLNELFLAEQQSGENFRTQERVEQFNQQSSQIITQALANHGGSGDSKAALEQMLMQEQFRFGGLALDARVKASHAAVQQQFGEFVNEQASIVAEDPTAIADAFAATDERIKNYSNTLTPEVTATMQAAAREQITSSAMDRYISMGDFDTARTILKENAPILGESRARSYRMAIRGDEIAARKARAEYDAKAEFLTKHGVDVSDPRIAAGLMGINLPSPKTAPLSAKIAAYEAATGKMPTQAQIDKMAGADVDEEGTSPFGNSLVGRSRARLAQDAPDFALGGMAPEQERLYLESAAAVISADPVTGARGTLSAPVQQALKQRGYDPNRPHTWGLNPRAQTSLGANVENPPPANPQTEAIRAHLQQPEVQETTENFRAVTEESRALDPQGGIFAPGAPAPRKTIFEMSDLVTGPISGAAAAAASTPIIGEFISAPETVHARGYLRKYAHDFVRVLQNSPKFAEGERQTIAKALELESRFIDRPGNFRNELIALDDFLADREAAVRETVESGNVGTEEYTQGLNVLNAMTHARRVLGVPPIATTVAEVMASPPGTLWRDPNNSMRVFATPDPNQQQQPTTDPNRPTGRLNAATQNATGPEGN